jgi:hypothetical protein
VVDDKVEEDDGQEDYPGPIGTGGSPTPDTYNRETFLAEHHYSNLLIVAKEERDVGRQRSNEYEVHTVNIMRHDETLKSLMPRKQKKQRTVHLMKKERQRNGCQRTVAANVKKRPKKKMMKAKKMTQRRTGSRKRRSWRCHRPPGENWQT